MDIVPAPATPLGSDAEGKRVRESVGRFLTAVPGLLQSMREAMPQDVFRVVMSSENAHLFKTGADGFYKPFLQDGGKFVENVNLAKVSPDYSRLAASVATQVQMAAIMAKLDRLQQSVDRVLEGDQAERRNAVHGRVRDIAVAARLSDQQERRSAMLRACGEAMSQLKVLADQLKQNIEAMPSEKGSLFEGFFGDKLGDARKAYDAVQADIAALASGCRAVLDAYDDLEEPGAARQAFTFFLEDVKAIDFDRAFQRARLVPGEKGKPAPELLISEFRRGTSDLAHALLPAPPPALELTVDYRLEELEALR